MISPAIVNDAIIVQLGSRGEDLGKLEIALDQNNKPLSHRWQVLALGPEYPDDPAIVSLVQRYRAILQPPTVVPTESAKDAQED